MFTHKKILAALLLAPLSFGCTVEDGDDETAGETGDTTAGSQTTQTTDTDPSATDTDSTVSATGTEATTDDPTATGDTTADTTDTDPDTTTGGGGGMFCQQSCAEDADCCAEGTEEFCPGDYPFNVTCVEGLCEYGGCTGDEDCALFEGTSCVDLNGFPTCAPICETDDDCLTEAGETCSGMADSGEMICQIEPAPCVDDASCGGFGTCNTETGACECADAAECPRGYECVGA